MDRRQVLASATALATMTLFARGAGAQAHPTKPIKVIVPFGAGSTTDVIARLTGNAVGNDLGQTFVIAPAARSARQKRPARRTTVTRWFSAPSPAMPSAR